MLFHLDMRFDCASSHNVCGAVLRGSIFPVNFRIKWLLWNLDMRFDCLVQFWHAVRLRRLAQSVRLPSGLILGQGIFPVNFRIKWLLWNLDMRFDRAGSQDMYVCVLGCSRSGLILGRAQARTKSLSAFYFFSSLATSSLLLLPKPSTRYECCFGSQWNLDMRFDCAGSHNVCGAVLGRSIFPVNFCIKWLLWNLDMRFDCLVKLWHAIRLRRLAQSDRLRSGLILLLVKSWHAFRLCRLARNVCLHSGLFTFWAHSGTRAGSHKASLCVLLLVFSCHVFSSPVARVMCCEAAQCFLAKVAGGSFAWLLILLWESSLTDRSRFLLVPVASSVAVVARSVVDRCLGTVITDRALLSAVKTNSPQMSTVVAVSGSNSECTRSQKSWSRVALFRLSCLVVRKISLSSPSSLTSPSSTNHYHQH